ncbi:MAG TPA: hypothetical protein VIK01_01705 [Polyangiaceae bacterium]
MRIENLAGQRTAAVLAMTVGTISVVWLATQHRTAHSAAVLSVAAVRSNESQVTDRPQAPVAMAQPENGSGNGPRQGSESKQLVAQGDAAAPIGDPEAEREATEQLYENSHAAEAVDSQWAPTARQTIQNTYSGDGFSGLRLTVDCRSTLCRVDVDYSDPAAGDVAAHKFMSVHPWLGRRMSHLDNATHTGTSYFAREGFKFPTLPSAASAP